MWKSTTRTEKANIYITFLKLFTGIHTWNVHYKMVLLARYYLELLKARFNELYAISSNVYTGDEA